MNDDAIKLTNARKRHAKIAAVFMTLLMLVVGVTASGCQGCTNPQADCGTGLTCPASSVVICGSVCANPPVPIGSACSTDLCDVNGRCANVGTCVPNVTSGGSGGATCQALAKGAAEACDPTLSYDECSNELYCRNVAVCGISAPGPGICSFPATEGSRCDDTCNQCAPGLRCTDVVLFGPRSTTTATVALQATEKQCVRPCTDDSQCPCPGVNQALPGSCVTIPGTDQKACRECVSNGSACDTMNQCCGTGANCVATEIVAVAPTIPGDAIDYVRADFLCCANPTTCVRDGDCCPFVSQTCPTPGGANPEPCIPVIVHPTCDDGTCSTGANPAACHDGCPGTGTTAPGSACTGPCDCTIRHTCDSRMDAPTFNTCICGGGPTQTGAGVIEGFLPGRGAACDANLTADGSSFSGASPCCPGTVCVRVLDIGGECLPDGSGLCTLSPATIQLPAGSPCGWKDYSGVEFNSNIGCQSGLTCQNISPTPMSNVVKVCM